MTISAHLKEFAGYPVEDYDPEKGLKKSRSAKQKIYRLSLSYDDSEAGETFPNLLDQFLNEPEAAESPALVVGAWNYDTMVSGSSEEVVEALVAARDRLPNLKALFFGDITYEQCEISWIVQSDVSPLLAAYPKLEHFAVRGANGLSFGKLKHATLKSLVIQSGGLGAGVIAEVAAAKLPNLEHLELWLGADNYGGITDVAPLATLLKGKNFPKLRYLGLRDSEIADQVAAAVAESPLINRIRVLDLSMGNLGDEGAQALLASPAVRKLEKLDISHHYVSAPLVKLLKKACHELDASDPCEADEYDGEVYRYISVSE